MKNTESNAFKSRTPQSQGFALVLVLAFLVLLCGMILAFFLTATSNRSAASQFTQSVNSKLLSDTAVNIIIGQVQKATSGTTTTAWASQPGVIRTFTNSGTMDKAFKLYSSGTMVETAAANLSNDLPPKDWNLRPAIYTDLNEPDTLSGTLQFPMVDPRAM